MTESAKLYQMAKKILVRKGGNLIPELICEVPENGLVSVGSDSSATIELKDGGIALEQLVIVCEDSEMTLMNRRDGTVINDDNLSAGSFHLLQPKDEIKIGGYTLVFDEAEEVDRIAAEISESKPVRQNELSIENTELPIEKPEIPIELPIEKPEIPLNPSANPFAAPPENDVKLTNANVQRNLSSILETLRSEEKYYFQIERETGEKQIFYVENEEMWLGWSADGECVISINAADVEELRAQIRKDWSGVVVYPTFRETVRLNSSALAAAHRLKNDDRLSLLAKNGIGFDEKITIKFHEPTALLVLDSILPRELPPPIPIRSGEKIGVEMSKSGSKTGEAEGRENLSTKNRSISKGKSRIFGYFTPVEIMIMTIGTLITAVIIFLVLEFF